VLTFIHTYIHTYIHAYIHTYIVTTCTLLCIGAIAFFVDETPNPITLDSITTGCIWSPYQGVGAGEASS
jgi:hypothetical protein